MLLDNSSDPNHHGGRNILTLITSSKPVSSTHTTKLSKTGNKGLGWAATQAMLMAACLVAGSCWTGQWPARQHDWVVAALLAITGAFFGIAGVWVLGRNRTIYPEPRPNSALIRHGIYRRVRHPLYTSVMLLAFGWGYWRHSLAALGGALVLTLFLILKSRNEETRLLSRFPDYEAYRRATRRFIPWLF